MGVRAGVVKPACCECSGTDLLADIAHSHSVPLRDHMRPHGREFAVPWRTEGKEGFKIFAHAHG